MLITRMLHTNRGRKYLSLILFVQSEVSAAKSKI